MANPLIPAEEQRLNPDQVQALDWAVIAASLIVILLVLLLAVWWPSRRASRIDPQTALRHE